MVFRNPVDVMAVCFFMTGEIELTSVCFSPDDDSEFFFFDSSLFH